MLKASESSEAHDDDDAKTSKFCIESMIYQKDDSSWSLVDFHVFEVLNIYNAPEPRNNTLFNSARDSNYRVDSDSRLPVKCLLNVRRGCP